MDGPWYETTGPGESDVSNQMQNSFTCVCLFKDINKHSDNINLQKVVSELFNFSDYQFRTITYQGIRNNPDWEKKARIILREEVIAQKPYGSWRGWSTFGMKDLRKKYLTRLIKEVWAYHILSSKFIPIWMDYNYCPYGKRQGYCRTKSNFEKNII